MAELTERDRRILEFIGQGRSDDWISRQFHISEQEIATIVGRIERKTGLHTRADLEQLGRSIKDAEKRIN